MSIIIPAYNEERRLPTSLDQVDRFVAAQPYPIEVVVVNNNSRDATRRIADEFAAQHSYVRVLDQPRQGKGAAVQKGMLAGAGEYLFICDADFSMPVEEISKFMPPNADHYDVAIASREVPWRAPRGRAAIPPPHGGRVFNLIVRVLAIPKIQDTQCGFKVFRRQPHARLRTANDRRLGL